jgi:hypothetical protein
MSKYLKTYTLLKLHTPKYRRLLIVIKLLNYKINIYNTPTNNTPTNTSTVSIQTNPKPLTNLNIPNNTTISNPCRCPTANPNIISITNKHPRLLIIKPLNIPPSLSMKLCSLNTLPTLIHNTVATQLNLCTVVLISSITLLNTVIRLSTAIHRSMEILPNYQAVITLKAPTKRSFLYPTSHTHNTIQVNLSIHVFMAIWASLFRVTYLHQTYQTCTPASITLAAPNMLDLRLGHHKMWHKPRFSL